MKEGKLILKYCLQNAVFYNGKANEKAVLGKVLANEPRLRKDIKSLKREIESTVKEVNSLAPEAQKEMLRKMAPGMLEKEQKEQNELPDIPGTKGKVITRFAPSPTGPLSLPHLLRAAMLSYLYAKKYKGKFILRFDDTDPKNIEPRFYKWIEEDLRNSGIKPDKIIRESDEMESYYKLAGELIEKGVFYVCTCTAENFREIKNRKQTCPCRNRKGTEEWKKMLRGAYSEGEASVRVKTSMKDPNPALRDPVMLRISRAIHPLKKRKYNVWPLYNFACVVSDHKYGITHVFRGKEHEHNTSVQGKIYEALGWEKPVVINFGMVYLPMGKIHTRDIKEQIKRGRISGWDDPRLPTIRALLRRGFQPHTFRQCAMGCGLSKTDINFSWDTLEGVNRKIIDPLANRYMVVKNPVRISLKNIPEIKYVEQPLHPDFSSRGKRKLPVSKKCIYIARDDYMALRGKFFRLKGLGNFKLIKKTAEYNGNEIEREMQKIQWVSLPNLKLEIVSPDAPKGERALGEQAMKKLKPGDLIQMERIGFGRVDSISGNKLTIFFAHK